LHTGPSAGRAQNQRLRLGAFHVSEGDIYGRPSPTVAKSSRYEQLMFVHDGRLGVRFVNPAHAHLAEAAPVVGFLDRGDALWIQAPLALACAGVKGSASVLCFQLHALPS
jgi:hypothetical protein